MKTLVLGFTWDFSASAVELLRFGLRKCSWWGLRALRLNSALNPQPGV